jgi:putative ABC transport system substrate-binding protein
MRSRTRRRLVGFLGGSLAAGALPARAQDANSLPRVGFFYYGSERSAQQSGRYDAFLRGMRDWGYELGRHYHIEARYADGNVARVAGIAAELLRANVDVIVTTGGPTTRAAQRASNVVPIVMAISFDPVDDGFAQSLARPGRNITGMSSLSAELVPKHLELLATCLPGLACAAVLLKPDNPAHARYASLIESSADKAGMKIVRVHARDSADIEAGIAGMRGKGVQAFLIQPETFFTQQSRQIADLASAHKLPSIALQGDYPATGGLMSYGPSVLESFYRSAHFVRAILKGAHVGTLPIEQPTKFELVMNLVTARALGVTIPQSMRLRADRLIE